MISNEQVDTAARAIIDRMGAYLHDAPSVRWTWDNTDEDTRECYRVRARAALEAIGRPGITLDMHVEVAARALAETCPYKDTVWATPVTWENRTEAARRDWLIRANAVVEVARNVSE